MLPIDYLQSAIEFALLEEVKTTPKPGLVDRQDNGSHTDMDYALFVKSTYAIAPYLLEMSKVGYSSRQSIENIFPIIREIGKEAEEAMYEATKGVNTHKGVIFSMGILSCCAGWYFQKHRSFDVNQILKLAGKMTKKVLQEDFDNIDHKNPKTSGEKFYVQYRERGIRGEVMTGFPTIRKISLPMLKKELRKGMTQNEAYLNVLLKIMSVVNDTNVIHRSDGVELVKMQKEAKQILQYGGANTEEGMKLIKQMNHSFIMKNISPGGCADLLAITIFSWTLEQYTNHSRWN